MRCCTKLKKTLLVVSEQDQIFSYAVCLSKSFAGISHSIFLIDGVIILSNTISNYLTEKEEHNSFLNIDC